MYFFCKDHPIFKYDTILEIRLNNKKRNYIYFLKLKLKINIYTITQINLCKYRDVIWLVYLYDFIDEKNIYYNFLQEIMVSKSSSIDFDQNLELVNLKIQSEDEMKIELEKVYGNEDVRVYKIAI